MSNYIINLTGFTFECYLNADYLGLSPEFTEEASEKYGATHQLYGAFIPKHEFNIYGNEAIQRFLIGLRVLECNGTVSVTYEDKTFTANDITAEISEDGFPGLAFMLKLSFVDHNEIVSVYNEIN